MYPFSISIDEHVPLNMSAGIFFPGRANSGFCRSGPKIFCRGENVAKLDFHHSQTRKQPSKNVMRKCQISKSWGGLGPPSDAHAPKTSHGKKAEEDNKIYLLISM